MTSSWGEFRRVLGGASRPCEKGARRELAEARHGGGGGVGAQKWERYVQKESCVMGTCERDCVGKRPRRGVASAATASRNSGASWTAVAKAQAREARPCEGRNAKK